VWYTHSDDKKTEERNSYERLSSAASSLSDPTHTTKKPEREFSHCFFYYPFAVSLSGALGAVAFGIAGFGTVVLIGTAAGASPCSATFGKTVFFDSASTDRKYS
jgi:hypothetical protein